MGKRSTPTKEIHGKVYYYERIELPRDVITGKRVRKTLYGETVKELNKKVKDYKKSLENSLNLNVKETFSDFMEYWLINVKFASGLKMSTKERYMGVYNNYVSNIREFLDLDNCSMKNKERLMLPKCSVTNLTTDKVQNFYNALFELGVKSTQVKYLHKLIKPCLTYACTTNRTVKDAGIGLIIPKTTTTTPSSYKDYSSYVFTEDEETAFINIIKGNREEVLYLLALSMGLRMGEILALKWSNINFDEEVLFIETSVRRVKDINTKTSQLTITVPKTSSSYAKLPIPSILIDKLKKHRAMIVAEKLKAGNIYIDNDLVFPTELGKYVEPSNLRKRYNKLLQKANIPHKRFHALRHTFATRLIETSHTDVEVMTLMRHSDIATTKNIYVHILPLRQRQIINKAVNKSILA